MNWNQRLLFHPHIHCIVPGAGLDADGRVVTVKNANFLVPQPALRAAFRARFRERIAALAADHPLPAVAAAVWHKDWGVHLQPFGDGQGAIKYLHLFTAPRPTARAPHCAPSAHSWPAHPHPAGGPQTQTA